MNSHPRLALIHATRVAIAPIEAAARALWSEAEVVSLLDESLSVDRARSETLTSELSHRICDLSAHAERAGAAGILYTCSAFGSAIETAKADRSIPVMNPNEAMFAAALEAGKRVAMIYTFPPAAAGMEDEFRMAARRSGAGEITSYFAEGALAAKQGGDDARHDALIVEAARNIDAADVIMLAQFSMAGAAEAVRAVTNVPVLTSPEAAIREMRQRVEAHKQEDAPC